MTIGSNRNGAALIFLKMGYCNWKLIRGRTHLTITTQVVQHNCISLFVCFFPRRGRQAKAHWTARFAAVRLTSDAPWEQERRIIGMVHSPLSESNIVLIKLETPVIYSDFVRPVCLAGDHQSWTSTNSRCVFLGWEKNGMIKDIKIDLHGISSKN